MRHLFILAFAATGVVAIAANGAARAQSPRTDFTTTAPAGPGATGLTPAPVPAIPPPLPDAAPSFVPERVAPPVGGGVGIGSQTSATPFSAGPDGTTLPDGQPPTAHDKMPDGAAGPPPGGR